MENKEKKYIVSYKIGIRLFISLIVLALIIFGIFYLIQEKKDRDFELGRPNVDDNVANIKTK